MTDALDRRDIATAKAQDELVRLNGQVAAMRAVLTQLLQDVIRAEAEVEHSQATRLQEANERLVISALGALKDAEVANCERDEAFRMRGLDQLTGLPNRTLLLDRLESAMSSAKRHGNRMALLFLDLNDFKQINDAFGHATGDQALRLIADCLTSLVRETDTVSRHGGDEFLILLAEVAHAADAATVAEKVNAALRQCSQIGVHEVRLTASIGISVYPEDGQDAKTLIDRADTAMYLAKKQQFAGFVFHTDPSGTQSNGQSSWTAPSVSPLQQRLTRYELEVAEYEQRHQHLREANEQLVLTALGAQELLAAAEEAQRRQSQLLALVANELRNPFAPIRIAAAALGRPGAEKTLLPRVQAIIEQQVDKMSRQVSELLDPRHTSKAQWSQGRQTFDAADAIGAAVEACLPAMERRRQTLDATIARPQEMAGDPVSLRQIVMNLLTYAATCTDNGGRIRLAVDTVEGNLLLTVVDGGRGISQHAAGPIFDPFVLDPRTSVHDDGIDARLMAVREIVQAQGGSFVRTMVVGGHGSRCTVSLPTDGLPRLVVSA